MQLHSDFSALALAHAPQMPWVASPMPGVQRRMLERIGAEVARATSIVRYEPGSHFSAHAHPGGEEFIVLDGVFQDEHGDYPAGSYVRNPPTSGHTPRSASGCTIFVKLWQFDPQDRHAVRLDMAAQLSGSERPIDSAILHHDARECVRFTRLAPGAEWTLKEPGGTELLVMRGSAETAAASLALHSWLRLPEGVSASIVAGPQGVELWSKTGHLPYAQAPSQ